MWPGRHAHGSSCGSSGCRQTGPSLLCGCRQASPSPASDKAGMGHCMFLGGFYRGMGRWGCGACQRGHTRASLQRSATRSGWARFQRGWASRGRTRASLQRSATGAGWARLHRGRASRGRTLARLQRSAPGAAARHPPPSHPPPVLCPGLQPAVLPGSGMQRGHTGDARKQGHHHGMYPRTHGQRPRPCGQ